MTHQTSISLGLFARNVLDFKDGYEYNMVGPTAVCPLSRLRSEFKMSFNMNSVTGESCITAVKLMRSQSHTHNHAHSAPKIADGIPKSPTAIPQENQHSCGRKKKPLRGAILCLSLVSGQIHMCLFVRAFKRGCNKDLVER